MRQVESQVQIQKDIIKALTVMTNNNRDLSGETYTENQIAAGLFDLMIGIMMGVRDQAAQNFQETQETNEENVPNNRRTK